MSALAFRSAEAHPDAPRRDRLLAVCAGLLLCSLLVLSLSWAYGRLDLTVAPVLALHLVAALLVVHVWLAGRRATDPEVPDAVHAERQRIARDLHDGLGFQLTTALSLARDGAEGASGVRLALELALVELHSVVHFAQSRTVPVSSAMASLRHRIQPVLDRRGVALVWQLDETIPDHALVGAAAQHFIRIVQEALSNVLQHAQATRLEIQLRRVASGRHLLLEISDNGRGLEPGGEATGAGARGKGLASMKWRASMIGAEFSVAALEAGGTCIRLAVPLPCPGVAGQAAEAGSLPERSLA